jgi:hypothetical protein
MGHRRLRQLEGDSELWTGDAFEYLYVKDGDKQHDLPPFALYQALKEELRRKVVASAEQCDDWRALATCLFLLDGSAPEREGRDK